LIIERWKFLRRKDIEERLLGIGGWQKKIERKIATYQHARYLVAITSGTAALEHFRRCLLSSP